MFCKNCGGANRDDATVCRVCGESLTNNQVDENIGVKKDNCIKSPNVQNDISVDKLEENLALSNAEKPEIKEAPKKGKKIFKNIFFYLTIASTLTAIWTFFSDWVVVKGLFNSGSLSLMSILLNNKALAAQGYIDSYALTVAGSCVTLFVISTVLYWLFVFLKNKLAWIFSLLESLSLITLSVYVYSEIDSISAKTGGEDLFSMFGMSNSVSPTTVPAITIIAAILIVGFGTVLSFSKNK